MFSQFGEGVVFGATDGLGMDRELLSYLFDVQAVIEQEGQDRCLASRQQTSGEGNRLV